MICSSCFNDSWELVWDYFQPDKYEKYCGIDQPWRRWKRCAKCGHYQSRADYTSDSLYKVYTEGYRDESFRDKSIKQSFDEIVSLKSSENLDRVDWVKDRSLIARRRLLDVGSGLGVFPYEMRRLGWDVWCTEINGDSIKFITDELKMDCFEGEPGSSFFGMFDFVSVIHVVEHTPSPELFLSNIKRYINRDGLLFIEVPDALEFKYLPKHHDEFNSCHLHFFTIPSLTTIVERAGFCITEVERVKYKERNLSRIRLLGRRDCV